MLCTKYSSTRYIIVQETTNPHLCRRKIRAFSLNDNLQELLFLCKRGGLHPTKNTQLCENGYIMLL